MRGAAEAIVDGDLRARVPVEGTGTAFGRQAQAFNHMLDRIEALMTSLAQISNDVAHDLRTPLARLHGQLARLAAEPAADTLRPQVEEALAQSEEILAMFAAILRITEVEGGDRRAMFRPLDLAGIAAATAESIEALADEKAQVLQLGPWEPAHIEGDARLLAQLVVNLVENAVNHTPAGRIALFAFQDGGGGAVIAVADNGPGIPAEQREKVFVPFYTTKRQGSGVGLTLVRQIATVHGAAVGISDTPGGGTTISIRF